MRAVSQTLWIIIAAIVILVTALVVITIFGTGIGQFSSVLEAKAWCATQGKSTCAVGSLPPTWSVNNLQVAGQATSCANVWGCSSCTSCEALPEWG